MMTGTPNVSNLPFAYRLLTLFFLLLFAIYDYRHHKVRNAALLAFLFWCLLSLPLTICLTPWPSIFSICLRGSAGFFTGLTLLLAVSMITDGGIGGGDIKLAALLGIVMGASLLLLAMFTASLAAIIHLELRTLIKKERITPSFYPLSFPWQPISPAAIILIQAACKFSSTALHAAMFSVPIAD